MKKIVTIWAHDEEYFLREICLLEAARWHDKLGIRDIDVLCLYGIEFIEKYRSQLSDLGYRLHDGSEVYKNISLRYSRIKKIKDIFIFNNFIRWIAIRDYFGTTEPICAFDADLVISSDILSSEALNGVTMTSTSTCFVVIHDMQWFSGYESLLQFLNDDPVEFQKLWDKTLDDYILRMVDDRNPINEESFVRFAVRLNKIPEHCPDNFPYYLVPFFLDFRSDHLPFDQKIDLPVAYHRSKKGDYWNNKPIAYTHFQFMFKEYIAKNVMLQKVFGIQSPGRVEPQWMLDTGQASRPDLIQLTNNLKDRCIRGEFGDEYREIFTRRYVMNHFLMESDLSSVFNERYWCTTGIFQ